MGLGNSTEVSFGTAREANTTVIAFTGAVAGAAFNPEKVYRLVATESCYVDMSTGNTATAAGVYLPANTVEYFTTDKTNTTISVIQASSPGNLHVTEMIAAAAWLN